MIINSYFEHGSELCMIWDSYSTKVRSSWLFQLHMKQRSFAEVNGVKRYAYPKKCPDSEAKKVNIVKLPILVVRGLRPFRELESITPSLSSCIVWL